MTPLVLGPPARMLCVFFPGGEQALYVANTDRKSSDKQLGVSLPCANEKKMKPTQKTVKMKIYLQIHSF